MWSEAALSIAPGSEFPAERGLLLLNYGILTSISGEVEHGNARILEGQRLLEEAGDRQSATRALVFAGMYLGASGNTKQATEHLDRALARAREGGDPYAISTAQTALAYTAMAADDYALARRHAEEAAASFPAESTAFSFSLAQIINVLGDVSRLEGKHEEARDRYERALALTRAAGLSGMLPSMQHNLAWSLHGLGDDERAIELFTSTAREFQQMGDVRGVAECLVGLGCAVAVLETAARLFAAGCSLLENHKMRLSHPNQRDYDRESVRVRNALGEETWQEAWAEGARLTPDQALNLVASTAPI